MIAAAALFVAPTSVAFAQSTPLPGAVQPGRDRPVPPPPAAEGMPYDFKIEAPRRSAVPRDVDIVHFDLKDIRIEGAVTLSPSRFESLYANLIGKSITLADIFNVADGIERSYREAGYPLVRAYVPPQRVSDGVFTIKVIEGYVATVSVQGGDAATQEIIKGYLAPVTQSKPLRLEAIEHGLLLANDLPGVAATGVLRASASAPGASDLIVTVAQPLFTGSLTANNRGSKFSGLWTIEGEVSVDSILLGGDELTLGITGSPHSLEQIGAQMRYRAPIGTSGLTGSLLGIVTHGQPGSTLRAFNVHTDSYAAGGRLTYPVLRSRAETLTFDGGFTWQDAKVNILGTGLSHDHWRVLDVDAAYLNRDVLGGTMAFSLDLAQGLPIFGADENGAPNLSRIGAHTDFTKISGGARYMYPIWDQLGLTIVGQGQYSFAPLVVGEQITFGGTEVGRGYDPGAITGDQGIGGSFELHYDQRVNSDYLEAIQPYVFFDAAATWYINSGSAYDPALRNQSIDSTGAGARFWFPYGFTAGVEVAKPLKAVPGSNFGKKPTKVLIDLGYRF